MRGDRFQQLQLETSSRWIAQPGTTASLASGRTLVAVHPVRTTDGDPQWTQFNFVGDGLRDADDPYT